MEWRGREWSGVEGRGGEGRGGEGRGGEGRGGEERAGQGRAGQGRVPDCLGGLSRVGISSLSTRPWNGQPPSKILKLDDLYKFELSKFMFDCINGLIQTPILDYFTTNATIHAHHTRQINIPHVTQTFGTISDRSVTHKGPKTWIEIPQTIRLHQNKYIFSRLLKHDHITKYN